MTCHHMTCRSCITGVVWVYRVIHPHHISIHNDIERARCMHARLMSRIECDVRHYMSEVRLMRDVCTQDSWALSCIHRAWGLHCLCSVLHRSCRVLRRTGAMYARKTHESYAHTLLMSLTSDSRVSESDMHVMHERLMSLFMRLMSHDSETHESHESWNDFLHKMVILSLMKRLMSLWVMRLMRLVCLWVFVCT